MKAKSTIQRKSREARNAWLKAPRRPLDRDSHEPDPVWEAGYLAGQAHALAWVLRGGEK